jgi:hypothetical protein
MNLEVEIDNRNAELAVYADERVRMVRQLEEWDAWGETVRAKKAALEAQFEASKLPTAVITPVDDSTAFGVIAVSEEEPE